MPHSYIEAETPPSSSSSANCSSSPPRKGGELSQSKQFSPSGSCRSKNTEGAEDLSLEATEPFPDDLFRIPVRDAVFREIPELSDVALRSLLALIHLSHRYDPAEESWIHTEEWLSRSEIEEAAGISSQGTRDGLEELEASGWARANREGRSYSYQLLLEVPDRRYTYLPTELLEKTSELGSAQLRVLLVVLRGTWGWTEDKQKPEGGHETVHARWTGLSTQDLSDATGRSETAVKRAIKALEGEWVERARPSSGAYHYRFLPEAVSESSRENSSSSKGTSKNLTPHRQKSDPPSSYRESLSRDKHSQSEEKKEPAESPQPKTEQEGAMPSENTSGQKQPSSEGPAQPNHDNRQTSEPNFSDLPPEKRNLAEKLANVGVWARRIAETLDDPVHLTLVTDLKTSLAKDFEPPADEDWPHPKDIREKIRDHLEEKRPELDLRLGVVGYSDEGHKDRFIFTNYGLFTSNDSFSFFKDGRLNKETLVTYLPNSTRGAEVVKPRLQRMAKRLTDLGSFNAAVYDHGPDDMILLADGDDKNRLLRAV
ncbi:hypothetical protein [Salinibacter ruber]|uniref:hypothetical protein n=1 Tax=Salinibacter ruber TaxID=146919 RepID=UPI002073602B|nr:hypothetical protein [Salinibacter ruber]